MTTFKWFGFLVLTTTIVPALLAEPHCPGNIASLPFRLLVGHQIVVPVSINHSGPYDFLLDTGTRMTLVGPSLANELNLSTRGGASVEGVGFNESAFFTQLDLLEAGSHAVTNQRVLVYGLMNLHAVDSRIRGILGEDFLQHFDMLIDFAHNLLCLDDSAVMRSRVKGPHIELRGPTPAQNGVPLPNLLIVTARLSGEPRPVRLMLDSGANIPYLYNTSQHLVPQLMTQRSLGGASLVGSGANGDQKLLSALARQEVKIGSLELPEVTFFTLAYAQRDSHPRDFDGLLTMNLFRNVFISYTDHFAVLQPR